ncbi:hypothetical protein H5410_032820 [Solanum commersonii]|uniref:Uncharacterized protein n=1 Tax=Solanum commersonii TaxID=4109 RepID=A0A9J5YLZ1_SOLCO|nr:hypothetical protein H5410_032820 [Solanum commersonii]
MCIGKLDQTIRKIILKSLGVEKYMGEHMNLTNYLLRVMKYMRKSMNNYHSIHQVSIDSH